MAVTRMGTATATLGANIMNPAYLEPFLNGLFKKLELVPLGKRSTLPEKNGKTIRWNIMSVPAADAGNIGTEGSDPDDSTDFTTATVTMTLAEQGSFTDLSKFLLKVAMSGTQEQIAERLGYQAALTYDAIVADTIDAGTNTQDSGTAMSAEAIRQAVSNLDQNDVEPHPATRGGAWYCAVMSKEGFWDMTGEGAPTWVQLLRRDLMDNVRKPVSEMADSAVIHDCVIKRSSNLTRATAASPDDDINYVFGNEAFGVAAMDTDPVRPSLIITPPDALVSAPLRNRGTMGWYGLFAAAILAQARMRLILTDATGIGV